MPLRNLILFPLAMLVVALLLTWRVIDRPENTRPAASQERQTEPQESQTEPPLIADPNAMPELVQARGYDAFTANCLNCHSARYVLMQPRFRRKVWTAEVAKMVKAYKANINPQQQAEIVDYLVAAYGAPDPTR